MNSQPSKDVQANAYSEQTNNPSEEAKRTAKEDAKILWDEYKYRHELCWKNTFQITVALVVLAIIPYLHKEVVRALGYKILAVPLVALALILFAIPVMRNELTVFGEIKRKYRAKQKTAFDITYKPARQPGRLLGWLTKRYRNLLERRFGIEPEVELGSFFHFVLLYLSSLLLLCIVNSIEVSPRLCRGTLGV